VVIGTFSGGVGTSALVINLNANATPEAVQALMRNITYRNVLASAPVGTRTVRFLLSDGDGGTSAAAFKSIDVT
jgi:hypothetical protein